MSGFLEVVAPDRLSLTFDDPDGQGSGSFEVVTVVLKDLGNGKTEMTFTQRGRRARRREPQGQARHRVM